MDARITTKTILSLSLLLLIVSCGGGGGSDAPLDTPPVDQEDDPGSGSDDSPPTEEGDGNEDEPGEDGGTDESDDGDDADPSNESGDGSENGGAIDSLGAQRTLVALVNFPDNNDTSFMSVEQARELIRDGDKSLNRFIVENSDGKTWVEPYFVDWVTLDRNSSFYFDEDSHQVGLFVNDAVSAIVNTVADASDYDRMIIMAKDGHLGRPGCFAYLSRSHFGSTSQFHGYVMVLSGYDMSCNRAGRIEHEFGHTLGFGHTLTHDCENVPSISLFDPTFGNDCSIIDLVSRAHDTMGGDSFQPMYSPAWREVAGWLDEEEILEVDQPGTYTLVQSSLSADGVKLIKIPFGTYTDGTRLYHYVELRTSAGTFDPPSFQRDDNDYEILIRSSDARTPRIVVRSTTVFDLVDYHGAGSVLDVGTEFLDKYRDVSISVEGVRGFGETLAVDLSIESPRTEIRPASVLRFDDESVSELTFNVRNIWLNIQAVSSVDIGGRDALNFEISANACDGLTLQPLQECAISVSRVSDLGGFATVHVELDDGDAQQLVELVANSIQDVPPYDPDAPLLWQALGSIAENVDWREAVQFCESLEEAGATNWRLPLIDELRGAFQLSHSPVYEIGRALWSATELADPGRAYYIYGNDPIQSANALKTTTNNALCVRSL